LREDNGEEKDIENENVEEEGDEPYGMDSNMMQ